MLFTLWIRDTKTTFNNCSTLAHLHGVKRIFPEGSAVHWSQECHRMSSVSRDPEKPERHRSRRPCEFGHSAPCWKTANRAESTEVSNSWALCIHELWEGPVQFTWGCHSVHNNRWPKSADFFCCRCCLCFVHSTKTFSKHMRLLTPPPFLLTQRRLLRMPIVSPLMSCYIDFPPICPLLPQIPDLTHTRGFPLGPKEAEFTFASWSHGFVILQHPARQKKTKNLWLWMAFKWISNLKYLVINIPPL